MGKKKKRNDAPEGMSRRQAKLLARAAERAALDAEKDGFREIPGFCDLIAMREFVGSATLPAQVKTQDGQLVDITIGTVLPGAIAALRRDEAEGGERYVGLQAATPTQNPLAHLAAALQWVSTAAPGESLSHANATLLEATAPALSDVLVLPAATPDTPQGAAAGVQHHNTFDWWLPQGKDTSPEAAQSLEQANEMLMTTQRLEATPGAVWWVDAGEKGYVRWIRPEQEDQLLRALIHVHTQGALTLGEGSRYAGMFRGYGILVPVFDVDNTLPAEHWEQPLAVLGEAIEAALAERKNASGTLSTEERRSRELLLNRQVTLR